MSRNAAGRGQKRAAVGFGYKIERDPATTTKETKDGKEVSKWNGKWTYLEYMWVIFGLALLFLMYISWRHSRELKKCKARLSECPSRGSLQAMEALGYDDE